MRDPAADLGTRLGMQRDRVPQDLLVCSAHLDILPDNDSGQISDAGASRSNLVRPAMPEPVGENLRRDTADTGGSERPHATRVFMLIHSLSMSID